MFGLFLILVEFCEFNLSLILCLFHKFHLTKKLILKLYLFIYKILFLIPKVRFFYLFLDHTFILYFIFLEHYNIVNCILLVCFLISLVSIIGHCEIDIRSCDQKIHWIIEICYSRFYLISCLNHLNYYC